MKSKFVFGEQAKAPFKPFSRDDRSGAAEPGIHGVVPPRRVGGEHGCSRPRRTSRHCGVGSPETSQVVPASDFCTGTRGFGRCPVRSDQNRLFDSVAQQALA